MTLTAHDRHCLTIALWSSILVLGGCGETRIAPTASLDQVEANTVHPRGGSARSLIDGPIAGCEGEFKDRTKPTVDELFEIHIDHARWLKDGAKPGDKRRANLCGAHLKWVDLGGTELKGADLTGATLVGAKLRNTSLRGAILIRVDFRLADLHRADLSETQLVSADLHGADLSEATLVGADLGGIRLSDARLSEANLYRADLRGARLPRANLNQAILKNADLREATLTDADLSGADLSGADLRRTDLSGADLSGADLFGQEASPANLRGANLRRAKLTNTNLDSVELNDAILTDADLFGAYFNPKEFKDISDLLGAKRFSGIRFEDTTRIIALRKKLKDAGFRSEEKALTSALRKHQLKRASLLEVFLVRFVLGGELTDYGANPSHSLQLLLALIFVFVWFYLIALQAPDKKAGIWRVRPKDRLLKIRTQKNEELVPFRGFWRTVPTALYFSLLSAFHFGWRDLNIANWMTRLQREEYVLGATGWVRVVSGVQSISSLYLIALWLVTYFGRPFE